MNTQKISNGLLELGFNSGWVVSGDEIVLWEHDEPKPSMSKILQAAEIWENKQIEAEAQAEAKRQAAVSKLAALGLTADDLKALGL